MLGNCSPSHLRAQGRLRDAGGGFRCRQSKRIEATCMMRTGGRAPPPATSARCGWRWATCRGAVAAAREAVDYAERAEDAFRRMAYRTTHADALHQAGDLDGAAALFAEAERLQAEQPARPAQALLAAGLPLLRPAARHAPRGGGAGAIRLSCLSAPSWRSRCSDCALEELLAGRAAHALASAPQSRPSPVSPRPAARSTPPSTACARRARSTTFPAACWPAPRACATWASGPLPPAT